MLTLIYKDLYLLRKTMLICAGIGVGLAVLIGDKMMAGVVGIYYVIVVVYSLTLRSAYHEDKDNALMFLRTLPVKPQFIVISKYATLVLLIAMAWLLTLSVSTIQFRDRLTELEMMRIVVAPVVAITIVLSIFLAMFFRWGYNQAVTYIRFTFFIPFLIPFVMIRFGQAMWMRDLARRAADLVSMAAFPYLLAAATLGIFLISMLCSLRSFAGR